MFGSLVYILLVAIVGFLLFMVFFYWNQDRLVYFPGDRKIRVLPSDVGLGYEEVVLTSADQVRLHGWFIPVDNPRGVILFCHGNAGNISHRLDSLRLLAKLGFSTLIFDYRGYGRSAGKPTERGTYLDVEAAYNYLIKKRQVKPTQIVLFGRSMGAAVAAHLGSLHQCGALIMESGFTSVPDLGQQLYPFLPVRMLSRYSYDSKAFLKKITGPVLIAHSTDDEIVPFSHGQQLFEAASEPKRFLKMKGGHNDGFYVTGQDYYNSLDQFLSEVID